MEMVQVRDTKGHYTSDLKPDAELAAVWAEEDRRGKIAVDVLAKLRMTPEVARMVKAADGAWRLGYQTQDFLVGALFGLFAGNKMTAEELADITLKICDALKIDLGPMLEKGRA